MQDIYFDQSMATLNFRFSIRFLVFSRTGRYLNLNLWKCKLGNHMVCSPVPNWSVITKQFPSPKVIRVSPIENKVWILYKNLASSLTTTMVQVQRFIVTYKLIRCYIYRPQRSNIITSVCQEFCLGGVCLSASWDTPPGQTPPPAGGYCCGLLLHPTGMHSCQVD